MNSYNNYPLLITRGFHVFPKCISGMDVGRSFSLVAVSHAFSEYEGDIIIVSQKEIEKDDDLLNNIFNEGTLCHIDSTKDNKGVLKVRLTGIENVIISNVNKVEDGSEFYYSCDAVTKEVTLDCTIDEEKKLVASLASILAVTPLENSIPKPVLFKMQKGVSAEDLANQLANYLPLDYVSRQTLLEESSINKKIGLLIDFLENQKIKNDVERTIQKKVNEKAEQAQKEYFLREKMHAIQDELDNMKGEDSETEKILKRIEDGSYSINVAEKIRKEVKRYEQLPAGSLESSMAKTYIDWLVDLPWTNKTVDNDSLDNARKVLDEDHYGLEKVKDRIIEYLAVKSVTKSLKAPIICLYGPPGVGKTSLAKSVARALGRKFVKAALGGTSDETEIRGHRRTYVASMPGKIIKGIKNAGVCNPVFLLDEIDKVTSNSHGDPASALLEVLDPEQNVAFQDNYLEETYDLSNVLFICTANYLENIPAALRDRLELIELNTYTEIEKKYIAFEHLIKKQSSLNGLKDNQIRFDEDAIMYIIRYYTREAGVRELERKIASICRKAVVELLTNKRKRVIVVNKKKVQEYLGTEIFDFSRVEKAPSVGVVTGLAYTQFGGEILPIEVNYFEGKGGLILTGNLGNVMKESASIALDYVKANVNYYKIDTSFFLEHDIHIHVPEGAVPKDGPSAGVAITTAIVSAVKNIPCKTTVAMTGEVNLRGESLAIGGLKEKTLAALRNGIETVLIPKENERNVADLPKEVKEGLKIIPINSVNEALKETLVNHDFF